MVKREFVLTERLVDLFVTRLIIQPSGHWRIAGISDSSWGYSTICGSGVEICSHVLSHMIYLGPVPPGMEVDHLCQLRWCVCPFHLQAMTHGQNIRQARGRECKRGHDMLEPGNVYEYTKNGRLARMCKPCNDLRNARRLARV